MKPSCQINPTLDPGTAAHVARIGRDMNIREGTTGHRLVLQRLQMEDAGWNIDETDNR